MGFSATYHLFCTTLSRYRALAKLDYAGITCMILGPSTLPLSSPTGCFYVALYYVFWCDTFLRNLYTAGITVVGACVASVTSLSVFSTNQYRHVRAGPSL